MDKGGSRIGATFSEEAQCGGPLGRAPVLETPKDMLRKTLQLTSVSLGAMLLGTWRDAVLIGPFRQRDM
jgi:hypothetical protein